MTAKAADVVIKSATVRPYEIGRHVVVALPSAFVKRYDIKEGLTEFEVEPVNGGFLFKLKRRGSPIENAA